MALARGRPALERGAVTIDNGSEPVRSIVLEPLAVTRDSIEAVVHDGFWSVSDICVRNLVSACEDVGLV